MQNRKQGSTSRGHDNSTDLLSDGRKHAPLRIGLTGNIGSGKSTVAALFSELGIPIFNADTIGHELLKSDPGIRSRVVEFFGDQVVVDGTINREKLGKIVFGSGEKRKKLESILHPAIMSAIANRIGEGADTRYAVIEVPLLYEAQLSEHFDYVILVKADRKSAVARASAKLGIGKQDVMKRLNAQIPQSEKEKLADFTIANDSSIEDLKSKVEFLHNIISSIASAPTGNE